MKLDVILNGGSKESLRTTGLLLIYRLKVKCQVLTSGWCMFQNVKAAAFKLRPFILMGVNNLFWGDCYCTYTATQWSQPMSTQGWGRLVFLFLAVTRMQSAQASPSAHGFTEVRWVHLTSSSLLLRSSVFTSFFIRLSSSLLCCVQGSAVYTKRCQ